MTEQERKVKLLVCCHQDGAKGDDLLVTVKAGAALGGGFSCDFADDDGENISAENAGYNELTVTYWAWKNYDKLGDPDYIGLMHYRRYFYLDEEATDGVIRTDAPESSLKEKAMLSREGIERALSHGDFICPRPLKRRSVYRQYAATQKKEDLDLAVRILKKLSPEYATAADEYLAGKDCFFFNMFLFPRELFYRYCAFLFPILEEFVREKGESGRLYVSERLTGIFLYRLIKERRKPVFLPVLYRDSGKSTLRGSLSNAKGLKQKALVIVRLFIRRSGEKRRI